jgi:hypothetical protein
MWWLLIPAVLLVVALFLLFSPIVLDLNSETGKCELRWAGVGTMKVTLDDERILLRFRIAGYRFTLDPAEGKHQLPRSKPGTVQQKKKLTLRHIIGKSRMLLHSFHVRDFHCDFDSNDYLLNSWLFPVAHWLDPSHRKWNINFNGRNAVALKIENNLWRLLRAWFS